MTKNIGMTLASSGSASIARVLLLGLLAVSTAAAAGPSEMKLTVSATVLKHASLKVLTQPTSVVVTAADIERGYVDVSAAAKVAVQSNTLDGYLLEFANQGDFMRQILVRGLGSDVQLSPAGGTVIKRTAGSGMSRTILDLGFRFVLSESVQQGTYAWPLRFSVLPL
jgi:hypothetical protein